MLALVYSFFIYKGKLEIVTMLLICLKEWGGYSLTVVRTVPCYRLSSDCHFLDSAHLVFPHYQRQNVAQ